MQIVIIGASASARLALDMIEDCIDAGQEYEALGFVVDACYGLPGTIIHGKPILGDFDWLARHSAQLHAICAIGDPVIRKRLADRAAECGARFTTICHPSVIRSRRSTVGNGCLIGAGVILSVNARVVDHVHLYTGCRIGHDSIVESYAGLSTGVCVAGKVTLGEGCFVGTGSSIIEKRTVGEWSILGAGSVVIADIPAYSVAVGVPAKVIKARKLEDPIFS
ncbi:MAG TPA: acetyltransferase [Candidatus Latescibacteria bacterium]|nr:acetyltransferase [Candidatus Latescibacterota bacterium]